VIAINGMYAQQRVTENLLTYYTFSEGSGTYIADQSGFGDPLLLKIYNETQVEWLPGGGLKANGPVLAKSLANASKIAEACAASGEITMEVWVKPNNTSQDGPCRIISCGHGTSDRNFMIGQAAGKYLGRLRTTNTGINGTPNLESPSSSVSTQLQHVVYTRSAGGNEKIYINGVLVSSGTRTGNFSNWNANYELSLFNEINADRPWLGEMYLSAVYSSALSVSEIGQNYAAGHNQTGGSLSNETCADMDCFVDGYGTNQRSLWIASLPFPVGQEYTFGPYGGGFDVFSDGTAHLYGQVWNNNNEAYGWYIDIWLQDAQNWSEWSALGRSWKGTASVVGNLYTTWTYYIMNPTATNVLIGLGEFEGSTLNLTHKPVDYHYGFQMGSGANDKNVLPGMSCWFDFDGTVNGTYIDGNGDVNLEGECDNLPVLQCAIDVEVSCDMDLIPELTGQPVVNCSSEYVLTYNDEIITGPCPQIIQRNWMAYNSAGDTLLCEQEITLIDEVAPLISPMGEFIVDCNLDTYLSNIVSDNCSEVTVSFTINDSAWVSPEECEPGMFRTQTQGGWGTNPNGNNPGAYLHAHFSEVFPNGLTLGCSNTLVLTSAQAVTDFLPSGSTPSSLSNGELMNPGGSYNNVFAGQVVALAISMAMDEHISDFGSSNLALADLLIVNGDFAGWSVGDVWQLANDILGGCNSQYTPSQLNAVISSINENFVDGTMNGGFLDCSIPADCYLWMELTFTASDECGNSSEWSGELMLVDTVAPVFPTMPVQLTVDCGNIPEANIEWTEECFDETISLVVEDVLFSGSCLPTIQRTYTATDQCGNVSVFVQFIAVVDTIAPLFMNFPEDINAQCNSEYPDFTPIVLDNCDENPLVTYSESSQGMGCSIVITRTWTATDACGNSSYVQQTIVQEDTLAPTISGQQNITATCLNEVWPTPLATDECGSVQLNYSDVSTGVSCSQIITRTWTAIDGCGNQSVFVQTISLQDNLSPVFNITPQNISLPCGSALPEVAISATDNCGEVLITYVENSVPIAGECAQIMRVWTATDACGNNTIVNQLVTFIDNTPPVFSSLPQSNTISCGEISVLPNVSATDNCDDNVSIMYEESFSSNACATTITRTWLALDNCGNAAFHTQTVTIQDDEAPVITGPSVVNVSCDAEAVSTVSTSDNCSIIITLTHLDQVLGSGCSYQINRTYTAADACGNTSSFLQVINVSDNEAPQFISGPANMTLACGMPPVYEEPIITDNCDMDVTIVYTETSVGGGCEIQLIRNWVVTDDCGNTDDWMQTITFVDMQPPVLLGVPTDILVECDEVPSTFPSAVVTATDLCAGDVDVTMTEQIVSGSCPQEYSIQRLWTAEDNCGNMVSAMQVIMIVDMTPPVFLNIPSDMTVSCENIPDPILIAASDNCDNNVEVVFSEYAPGGGCPILIRTWIAFDDCGNSSEYIQTIHLEDNEPPILEGLPPVGDVDCTSIPPMPEPQASDNCDQNVSVTASQSIIGSGCQYTIIRTWIAEDDCGNSTVVSQSFVVTDTGAPVFVNVDPDITVECADVNALPMPPVLDDCGSNVAVFYVDQVLGSGCMYDIIRTYTAMDLCGNSANAEQLIHVVDTEGPIFTGVPASTTVQCDNIPLPAFVTANDACSGSASVQFSESTVGGGCFYQIIRTWTAADFCGNESTAIQVLSVMDSQAPIFTDVPENLTLGCNEFIPPAGMPFVIDNCVSSALEIEFFETQTATECGYQIMRTWSSVDYCGNEAEAIQIIVVEDQTAPQFVFVPVEMSISCDQMQILPSATASDDCGTAEVFYVDMIIPGNCPYQIERTWIAVDNCGNTSQAAQIIWVSDNEAPIIVGDFSDQTIECGEIAPYPIITAHDNCTDEVSLLLNESFEDLGCTQIIHRQWTANDLCGNLSAADQWITITDSQAPYMQVQEELFAECDEVLEFVEPQISDCSEYTVEMAEYMIPSECASEYDLVRTWIATDICGNENVGIQTIHVFDVTEPVLSDQPENISVSCHEIPPVAVITATDNCDVEVEVEFLEEIRHISGNDSTCYLSNTISPAGDLVVLLPGLDGYSTEYIFGEAGGVLVQNFSDGTAHLTGQVYAMGMPEQSWIMDVVLRERRDWNEWSALGRSYKDDMGLAGDDYLDWTYYELDESSVLIGAGVFEGSVLSLSHAPANFYYGFQLGFGANNRNAEFGMSGWLFYSGEINGIMYEGPGDIMTENNCCPLQEITRTWTAFDCAGNAVTYTQVITVGFEAAPSSLVLFQEEGRSSIDVQDGNRDFFTLSYHMYFEGQVNIDLYNQSGQILQRVFSGNAERETKYVLSVPKHGLSNGMYYFTLTSDSGMISERGMVIR
jgi:hypothetical protein